MSFSFNFELADDEPKQTKKSPESSSLLSAVVKESSGPGNSDNKKYTAKAKLPAYEVQSFYDESIISKLEKKIVNLNDQVLKIVDTNKLELLMSADDEFQSLVCKSSALGDIVSHSDLVNGVYEGGLKIWECGIDLAKFLSSRSLSSCITIEGMRVLELGCGAGVPGIYCVKCRAARVDFQDYNVEVLKLLTHTNVGMNSKQNEADSDTKCHYYAGDWQEFSGMNTNQNKYDIILSAETIYNVDNYHKLHNACDKMLAADGVVLIAAKEYYFGVGGGVDSFLEYVDGQNCFDYETVWETKTGVPRKILMLKRRTEITKTSNVES